VVFSDGSDGVSSDGGDRESSDSGDTVSSNRVFGDGGDGVDLISCNGSLLFLLWHRRQWVATPFSSLE